MPTSKTLELCNPSDHFVPRAEYDRVVRQRNDLLAAAEAAVEEFRVNMERGVQSCSRGLLSQIKAAVGAAKE